MERGEQITSHLGRAMNYFRVTHMGISTMEQLRFKRRAFHVPNLMPKLL